MRIYFDCRNGISGDMALGALVHVGLDLAPLEVLLGKAGIACQIVTWEEQRAAGPGMRLEVRCDSPQPLRQPRDLAAAVARVEVPAAVRHNAQKVLDALTEAKAHAHGISVGEVHFHELGAIDTLVNIVGVAWGLHELKAETLISSPLPMFSGWRDCDCGRLPLPAPATAYLLQGKDMFPTEATTELVTPTGAALVHALALCGGAWPTGRVRAMGTGYGSRPADCGLRAWLVEDVRVPVSELAGEAAEADREISHSLSATVGHALSSACGGQPEEVLQLECHVDHLTGEEVGAAIEALSTMREVLDVLWLGGIGKKNRPCGLLRLLCLPAHGPTVGAAVLRHTHSLGLRWQVVGRTVLPRKALVQEGRAAKAYVIDGQEYVRVECDALKAAATKAGLGLPAMRIPRK